MRITFVADLKENYHLHFIKNVKTVIFLLSYFMKLTVENLASPEG